MAADLELGIPRCKWGWMPYEEALRRHDQDAVAAGCWAVCIVKLGPFTGNHSHK